MTVSTLNIYLQYTYCICFSFKLKKFFLEISGSSWSAWSDCVVPIGNRSENHPCGPGTRQRTIGYNLKGEGCQTSTPRNESKEKCHVTCQIGTVNQSRLIVYV